MRVWYDTEFLEDGKTIELISIGMVREDGEEYYAVVDQPAITMLRIQQHEWLRENVLPSLPTKTTEDGSFTFIDPTHPDVKKKRVIAQEVRDFIVGTPESEWQGQHRKRAADLWAWYGAYDHVALCWLWGPMSELPPGVPMYTNDIKQECVRLGDPKMPVQRTGTAHNALEDARHNRRMHEYLEAVARHPSNLVQVSPILRQIQPPHL
jgi:3' exoribonuclease, RNase T-like